MQTAIKLRLPEECQENGFWGWLEGEMSGTVWEDEYINKLVSLFGIISGHLGIIAYVVGYAWVGFYDNYGYQALPWYNWLFIALGGVSFIFQLWGLLKWTWADAYPNAATIFRAWRTNFLAQSTGALLAFLAFLTWLLIRLLIFRIIEPVAMAWILGVGLVFSVVPVYMIFFLKAWWYNYDFAGGMRCDENWDLFGNDEEFDELAFGAWVDEWYVPPEEITEEAAEEEDNFDEEDEF